ncbi:aldolase/citrate lyase family protein [Mesorhizobium sp. Z1-4]|uniref:aldolase/citrate lyase family protein n=1 Tax=Mesorhizobium sp. Z1-4 TaxID=2448478 RepID=UPI0013DEDD53|nr:aldolase/citrate lyase family protein [Mesorhizobium sp. Z1-4]
MIYITNDPAEAALVRDAGVDLVMVDLEILGKETRQGHLDTVISRHRIEDVSALRAALGEGELVVRINPLHEGSQSEIEEVVARGADLLMLPMFTNADELARFVELVDGRAATVALLETGAALARLPEILKVAGVDSIHFGLNDLHLALGLDFMFEVMSGGLMDHAAGLCNAAGIRFGIGGVARLGQGVLPADLVLAEHCRLGSQRVILSRDFRTLSATTPEDRVSAWTRAVGDLRRHLVKLEKRTISQVESDQATFRDRVTQIATLRAAAGNSCD